MYIKKRFEAKKCEADNIDPRIAIAIDMVPKDGEWTRQAEEQISETMDDILYDALGENYTVVDGHIGDEDACRYDLDVDYNGCKVVLRTFNGDSGAYMDVFVYCEGGKNGYGTAYGPERGLTRLDNLKEVIDNLCEEAKRDAGV